MLLLYLVSFFFYLFQYFFTLLDVPEYSMFLVSSTAEKVSVLERLSRSCPIVQLGISALERLLFRRRTFHVPNLTHASIIKTYVMGSLHFPGKALIFRCVLVWTTSSNQNTSKYEDRRIKFDVWISTRAFDNLGRSKFELSFAHEKFDVWTGPKIAKFAIGKHVSILFSRNNGQSSVKNVRNDCIWTTLKVLNLQQRNKFQESCNKLRISLSCTPDDILSAKFLTKVILWHLIGSKQTVLSLINSVVLGN